MKQRVVVAMLAFCALLGMNMDIHAQVIIELNVSNEWTSIPSCPNQWKTTSVITITETNKPDFWDAGSNAYFDLYIALPPGLEFENVSNLDWTAPTSADLQNGSGDITYTWVDVKSRLTSLYPGTFPSLPTWPARAGSTVNTLVLNDFHVKNGIKLDVITIPNVSIRLLPGSGLSLPAGKLYAWIENPIPQNATLPGGYGSFVRGLPTDGNITGGSPTPPISYQPGTAEGIIFVTQPIAGTGAAGTYHDVQERIKKGTGPDTWPSVQAVDCNGYLTTVGLASHPVVLSLVDAGGSPVATPLWDGQGPTYLGATPTLQNSTAWDPLTGKQLLQFSVNGPGDFRIRASAPTLPITPAAVLAGVSTTATSSTVFGVRQRPVVWEEVPAIPGTWDLNADGLIMPIWGASGSSSSPTAEVRDLYGALSTGDMVTFDFKNGTAQSTPPTPLGTGRYSDTKATVSGYAVFDNSPQVTFLPSETGLINFGGYVFVSTSYYDYNTVSGTLHLDPRYTSPSGFPNSIVPLPVELTSFTALLRNGSVQLKWTTATETNNYGFDVERSLDGTSWEKLGFVAGFGTTSSQRDYGYTNKLSDADMLQRTMSYRLRQIDRDGTDEYSPVVTVALAPAATNMTLLQNFPNPFNPSTNITFNLPESGAVTLTVYNELGIEVARLHDGAQLEAGWHTASFDASALPSGVYMYRLTSAAGTNMKTMIVSK